MTDAELLRRYTDEGSQLAFGELVARHMDWVHSAAVRLSGDHHQADDVTQAVFIALCRRAGSIAAWRRAVHSSLNWSKGAQRFGVRPPTHQSYLVRPVVLIKNTR